MGGAIRPGFGNLALPKSPGGEAKPIAAMWSPPTRIENLLFPQKFGDHAILQKSATQRNLNPQTRG